MNMCKNIIFILCVLPILLSSCGKEYIRIGDSTGQDNYTEEGKIITTPPKGLISDPPAEKTLDASGNVIYPSSGIRVIGEMSLKDFKDVIRSVKRFRPKSASKLRSNKVHLIKVESPDKLTVMTGEPVERGDLHRGGDDLILRKKNGSWDIEIRGFWVP